MPDSLNFLYSIPNFLRDYTNHTTEKCFESVGHPLTEINIDLLSNLFQINIILYSVLEGNNVLLSSIFNGNFQRKLRFIAYPVKGIVYYGVVFEKPNSEHYNSSVSKELQTYETPLLRKEESQSNFIEESIMNEKRLETLMKKYQEIGIETEDKAEAQHTNGTDSVKPEDDFNPNLYFKMIGKYMNTVSQIELNLQRLRENDVGITLSSAGSDLSAEANVHTAQQIYE